MSNMGNILMWRYRRASSLLRRTPFYLRYPEFLRLPSSPGDDRVHLAAVMEWLCRAQDATGCGGVSAYYDLVRRQWAAPYRETTGYIIPTFLAYSHLMGDQEYRRRAMAMGDWELAVQMPNGAVGEPDENGNVSLKVFNTGQVMFRLCALYDETLDDRYLKGARQAADWLLNIQDENGGWSQYSNDGANGIDSRVAWAILEVFARTGHEPYRDAAGKKIDWVLSQCLPSGWYDHSSLSTRDRPWTHAIAYTISGLLESAKFLPERRDRILETVTRSARELLEAYEQACRCPGSKFLPCSFDRNWHSPDEHSCLTGDAQIGIIWMRLEQITGSAIWRPAAEAIVNQVASTQLIREGSPELRGGIAGSYPIDQGYCDKRLLNWASKFFADAVMMRGSGTPSHKLLG
jgi:Pectic acid lyase